MARRLTGWRRLAMASWGAPRDPQFFGDLDLDAAAMLAFVEDARRHTGVHLTLTHLVGRGVAQALAAVPELRVRRSPGGLRERDGVDVFFIVTTEGGRELTGVKVADADRKAATAIAEELQARRATSPPCAGWLTDSR